MNLDKAREAANKHKPKVYGAAPLFVIPPCHLIFDKAWLCVGPINQSFQYYVHGQTEDCMDIVGDWALCMQCKMYSKESDKQVITRQNTQSALLMNFFILIFQR